MWIASAGLAVGLLSTPAQALSINFDATSPSFLTQDRYGPGAGVFGSSTSVWNHASRNDSLTDFALLNDAGAASGVTVTYDRLAGGGALGLTGAYAFLGNSAVEAPLVTIKGLTAGSSYDLAVYTRQLPST